MVKEWRLIVDSGNVYYCMALDEAMLTLRARGEAPSTLRLYVISPPAVTIGRFQSLRSALNIGYAVRSGINFTRRITGGGSVLHDTLGEVTYSVVCGESEAPEDVVEAFHWICRGVVKALEKLGLSAEIKGVNDVVVNGRKISGNAQARVKGALLQHGTLMYASRLELLEQALVAPKAKLESHGVKSIVERVTTVQRELGRSVSRSEVLAAMIHGFSEALGVDLIPGRPSSRELELASKLEGERYRQWSWIAKKP